MTKDETLDWLYRLRSEIYVYMPKEWLIPMNNALDDAIKSLKQQPCEDAISRQAAIDGLKGCMCEDWVKTLFATMVKQLPSVTQKSETGHWINLEKKYKGQVLPFWGRYGCSKCGGYGEGTFNYCPNCGCRMQESEE